MPKSRFTTKLISIVTLVALFSSQTAWGGYDACMRSQEAGEANPQVASSLASAIGKDVIQMQALAEQMALYYRGGIGGNITSINCHAYNYTENLGVKDVARKSIETVLFSLEALYSTIPFSQLDEDIDEFKPLFEINRLLPQIRQACSKLWDTPQEADDELIYQIALHIVNLGRLYNGYLHNLVRQIRETNGYENYTIEVPQLTNDKLIRVIDGRESSFDYISFANQQVDKSHNELTSYIETKRADKELIEAVKDKLNVSVLAAAVIEPDKVNRERLATDLKTYWGFDEVLAVESAAELNQMLQEERYKNLKVTLIVNNTEEAFDLPTIRIIPQTTDIRKPIRDYLRNV